MTMGHATGTGKYELLLERCHEPRARADGRGASL